MIPYSPALLLWAGCPAPPPATVPDDPQPALLSVTDRLARASMVLRGVRPTAEELDRVLADPAALDALIAGYAASPAFGEVMKDMHGEQLLLRADSIPKLTLPQQGPMAGIPMGWSRHSEEESALELVKYVALQDLPYTEIVTADYTFGDRILSVAFGLDYDPAGPEWQKVDYPDERPTAGLLSETAVWRRHVSNGFNFNRLRAEFVTSTLLCDAVNDRDVVIEGSLSISDAGEVSNAVATQPECVSCHQIIDPIGAFLWGFKPQMSGLGINQAYSAGCGRDPDAEFFFSGDMADYCYPLQIYSPETESDWAGWGLRPPSFYGQPAERLDDLGALVAADPRFAECTVRRFYGWFAQVDPLDVPRAIVDPLTERFVDGGWSAQQLAVDIVTHETFLASDASGVGLLATRPEQYARVIETLTGFEWRGQIDDGLCRDCWGDVDLGRTALYGHRMLAGGNNGDTVYHPTHTTTPIKWMVLTTWAEEAAAWVVEQDLRAPIAERRLLTQVGIDTTDEGDIRAQLAALHRRILTETVDASGPEVDELYALFASVLADGEGAHTAWTTVITALLLDIRLLLH